VDRIPILHRTGSNPIPQTPDPKKPHAITKEPRRHDGSPRPAAIDKRRHHASAIDWHADPRLRRGGCLIFAGMGDIHIHAVRTSPKKRNRRRSPARGAGRSCMARAGTSPNAEHQPRRSMTPRMRQGSAGAKSEVPVVSRCTPASGRDEPLTRVVPYKGYWGQSVGICFFRRWGTRRPLANYAATVSFHC